MTDILQRLESAQKDCFDEGQLAAAILLQDARAEIVRLLLGQQRCEVQTGDVDLAHPERLQALSDAADYVEKIGARYHSGRDIANGIRCLGPRSPTVAQAQLIPPEPYWLPFKVVGGCIRDAKDNYVAELSSPFGGDIRDQMAKFLVAAANAVSLPKIKQWDLPVDLYPASSVPSASRGTGA